MRIAFLIFTVALTVVFCVASYRIHNVSPVADEHKEQVQKMKADTTKLPKKVADYDTKNWTDILDQDPTVAIDIRYATPNNFVKEKMYDCARCFLRPNVAKAIEKIHVALRKKGYGGLKMFDCYRPKPYQQRLWDKMPDARYVTPPWKGSQHNRGAAVDLTIVDKAGKELDMGTEYDFFGERAYHDFKGLPADIQANRTLLKTVMEQNRFRSIRTEWWHYSFVGKEFPIADWVWKCD